MTYGIEQKPHGYQLGAHANYTWAANFHIPPFNHTEVIDQLTAVAQRLPDPIYGISGAMRGTKVHASSVSLGLDPSRAYGTPSPEQCEEIAAMLGELSGWQRQDNRVPEHRIIMGRRKGYEADAETYSYEQVLDIGRACLTGHRTSFEQAELFSVRHVPGERTYDHHEPAVIISGGIDMLEGALHMASRLGQERFVSEVHNQITQVYQQPATHSPRA